MSRADNSANVLIDGKKDPPYTPEMNLTAETICTTWNYVLKQMGKDISLRCDEVLELLTVAQMFIDTVEEDE